MAPSVQGYASSQDSPTSDMPSIGVTDRCQPAGSPSTNSMSATWGSPAAPSMIQACEAPAVSELDRLQEISARSSQSVRRDSAVAEVVPGLAVETR